jgi:hypothetical protein
MSVYEDNHAVECWRNDDGDRTCKLMRTDDTPEDAETETIQGTIHMTKTTHVESLPTGTETYFFEPGVTCHIDGDHTDDPRELICGDHDE